MAAIPSTSGGSVGRYTGADGPQQSAEEVIFSLPNGLQGYVLFGAWNQRRVDAFTNIVRDPRVMRYASDTMLDNLTALAGRLVSKIID